MMHCDGLRDYMSIVACLKLTKSHISVEFVNASFKDLGIPIGRCV